jgi:hypothetical protein
MTRLVPLALASLMTLSGCATQTGYLRADPPHAAAHDAPNPHAATASVRSMGNFFAGVADLAALVQDISATNDDADANAADAADDAEPDPVPSPAAVRVAQVYYGYDPARPLPPAQISMPVTAADPPHHPLDPALALAAVRAVDVSSCSEGGPGGYCHVRVTFGANGHPVGVLLEAPPGLPQPAVDCVQRQFGTASVPPFDGSPMRVGTSFYVRGGATSE